VSRRPFLELYIRWMQEIRRFKPSTVSRRFSVVAGFYRIDESEFVNAIVAEAPSVFTPARNRRAR
jgi:integrase/recombinase XerD